MINKNRDKDLDFSFKEINEFRDNITDEILIFLNYLFDLDNFAQLSLTEFNFFLWINFMVEQGVKTMINSKLLNLG